MFWRLILVGNHERVLVAKNGRFGAILMPGRHRIFIAPGVSLEIERHNVRNLVFHSAWTNYLLKEQAELVERHFICVETNEVQVGLVYVDGTLFKVIEPAKRLLLWRDQAEVTAEIVEVIAGPEIPLETLTALELQSEA
jgi:hypothetical protein